MSSESARRLRLMKRVHALHKIAIAAGCVNSLVESSAYHLLECDVSRPRAILRYLCYAIRKGREQFVDEFTYRRRYCWLRYVKRLPRDEVERSLDKIMIGEIEILYGPNFLEDMAKILEEEEKL